MDLSAWMLSRLLPDGGIRLRALVPEVGKRDAPSMRRGGLNSFLSSLGAAAFAAAVECPPETRLDDLRANQLAAMIETAAQRVGVPPPRWAEEIQPMRAPWFASTLSSLRLHLLTNSPPAFRRRNLFVDSTLGDRV